jgi:single-strand DNA-binding protein
MLNQAILIGRLANDVSSRTVGAKDTQISSFRLAWNNPRNKQEKLFIDIDCFGHTAKFVDDYLKKGDLVAVSGRIKTDSWEGKNNEGTRYKTYIVAETVNTLGGKGPEASEEETPETEPAPKAKSDTKPKRREQKQEDFDVNDDIPF